jgi:hypothetical protein
VCGGSFREPSGLRVRRRPRGMNAAYSAPLPTRLLTAGTNASAGAHFWFDPAAADAISMRVATGYASQAPTSHQAAFSKFNSKDSAGPGRCASDYQPRNVILANASRAIS